MDKATFLCTDLLDVQCHGASRVQWTILTKPVSPGNLFYTVILVPFVTVRFKVTHLQVKN